MQSPHSFTWSDLSAEVQAIYSPPTYSAGTRRWLMGSLHLLERHAGHPEELTPLAIVRARQELTARQRRGAPIKAITVNTYLRGCSSLCGYLVKRKILAANPFEVAQFALPQNDEQAETWAPSLEQLRKLLDQADAEVERPPTKGRSARARAQAAWRARRNRALLWLVSSTGLRAAEALGVLAGDVDLAQRLVYVRANRWRRLKTKGSEQPVPLTAECADILAPWLDEVREIGFLFPGSRLRGPWLHAASGWRACDQIKGLGERAGVNHITLKCLRHAWATHATVWGLSREQIRAVLRHTNLRTQTIYRHVDVADLHEIAARVKLRVIG